MKDISKRVFRIVGFESKYKIDVKYTLLQLHQDDGTELLYTLQEDIDTILDLKVNETLPVRLDRGDKHSIGVLIREN